MQKARDTWVAQSVKPRSLAQAMISQFVSSSPASGSVLTAWSLLGILCPSPSGSLSLSLSKLSKHFLKIKLCGKTLKRGRDETHEVVGTWVWNKQDNCASDLRGDRHRPGSLLHPEICGCRAWGWGGPLCVPGRRLRGAVSGGVSGPVSR